MVKDLLANYELEGMPRIEIEQMLGRPADNSIAEGYYIYWAGYAGIDDMWLEVRFEGDRAVEALYYPD